MFVKFHQTVEKNPKCKLGVLVRTPEKKNVPSEVYKINYSYNPYSITEVLIATIQIYRINIIPERYTKASLKKSELTVEQRSKARK